MTFIAAVRRAGLAGVALAAVAGSIAMAAPSEAAPGVFRYEGYANLDQRTGEAPPPEPQTIMSPAAGECIKTPDAANAENYTLSAVMVFQDENCKNIATTVKPFDTDASPFDSIMAVG